MAMIIFDFAQWLIVAIFLGLVWSSSLPILPTGSKGYWLILGLTIAYLILLLIKIGWRISMNAKGQSKPMP